MHDNNEQPRNTVMTRSYTIRPHHDELIREFAAIQCDGNESMALRIILDRYATMTATQLTLPLPLVTS